MKIAVDISQMAYQGTGVARYVHGLTKALLQARSEHQFIFYAGALRSREFFTNLATTDPFNQATFRILPLPPKLATRLQSLPVQVDKLLGNPDLLHTSDWAEPISRCPRVTTVHDLVFHKFPETVDPGVLRAQTTRLMRVVKFGTHIIADSLSTKNDLKEIYHLKDEQIDVVYPGIDQAYKPQESNIVEQVKTKYGITGRYLLSVGTQEPRKNLNRVIEAFKLLKAKPENQDLTLVLTGKYGWGKEAKLSGGVITTGYVEDKDLPALYSGAEVFVYPSLYEGFGFPVLEAMACGTAVVTSNISSLPELAGGAAILVDPYDVQVIAHGIEQATKLAKDLSAKGLHQAANFGWEKAAEQVIRVYENIGDKS